MVVPTHIIAVNASHSNAAYSLWLQMLHYIPTWVGGTGASLAALGILILALYALIKNDERGLFHALEKLKLKTKDMDASMNNAAYLEITIPKNSQATAFQVQQKLLKAVHAVYTDPIAGPHDFNTAFYLLQKWLRLRKVKKSKQSFFAFQLFAEYPYIACRLQVPTVYLERMESAIYNAYPNAEISAVNKEKLTQEILKYRHSYLAYGESIITGDWYHRIKTFKDISSDPVDSIVAAMEGLSRGRYMAYNITLTPVSHYFNQIISFLLDYEEYKRKVALQKPGFQQTQAQTELTGESVTSTAAALTLAMLEKMKSTLFQATISYWAIAPTSEAAEAKVAHLQAVLTELNQKTMNTLVHRTLFTKQVEELHKTGELTRILNLRPIIKAKGYTNHGQIISEGELYSLWHVPNTSDATVSSLKLTKFKKLPATQTMRAYDGAFFVDLGTSNFRMQEEAKVGIATWDDFKKHVYIVGGTGAGKSETLKRILHTLLLKQGDERTALLIIDPKNDFATDLLAMIPDDRKDDVIYFNPAKQHDRPLSFPFFPQADSDEEQIDFLISLMRRFVQIDSPQSWGPELENILRQLFSTAYYLPEQSLSGLDLLLHDPLQIKNILRYLPPRLQQFWTQAILKRTSNDLAKYLATTNNKLGKFLDYPELMNIVDRLDVKITFSEMIQSKKIFIANLGSSSEQMKKYYSVYLAGQIAEAVFRQAKLPADERSPAVFVVDEFQRVASDIFETLFSEVRAFNTALVISNQFMGQLDERIKKSIESNIATKIFMRTQSTDDALIAETILGKVTAEDIINLPTGSAYLKTLVEGVPQEAMSINIERVQHTKDVSKDIEAFYLSQTMERYGTPLDVTLHKRTEVNTVYYTAKRERVFFEQMARKQTFQEDLGRPVKSTLQPEELFVEDALAGSKISN